MTQQTEEQFDGDLGDGDLDGEQTPPKETHSNKEWARLRKAEQRAKELERDLAFRDAGINPADEGAPPHTEMFVKNYDGELTKEAIQAEAIRMRILKADPPPQQDPAVQAANAQQAEGLGKVDGAADGAAPPSGGDPIQRLDEAFLAGGDAAVEEAVRQAGVPVRYSS